jgi:hemerythrin
MTPDISSAAARAIAPPAPPPGAWHDDLLLGHGAIDEEHQAFLREAAALHAASDEELPARLAAVAALATAHFAQEDRWMRETGFPAADCHIDEHAAVLATLNGVRARLAQGDTAVVREVAGALLAWFPPHVVHLDSALAHWLNKRRFGGKPVVVRRRAPTAEANAAGDRLPC